MSLYISKDHNFLHFHAFHTHFTDQPKRKSRFSEAPPTQSPADIAQAILNAQVDEVVLFIVSKLYLVTAASLQKVFGVDHRDIIVENEKKYFVAIVIL
jgi:hypothetical protein